MASLLSHRPIGTQCFHPRLGSTLTRPSRLRGSNLGLFIRSITAYNVKREKTEAATPKKAKQTSVKRAETKAFHEYTEEEQIAQVERMMAMSTRIPTIDLWGQKTDTLDVILPTSTRLSNRKKYPTWRAMYNQFMENRLNDIKNLSSLLQLAKQNAIPGVDLSETTRTQRYITQWPWRIFTTKSSAKGSWMEHLRQEAVRTYTQLNSSLARRDDKTIKELCSSSYQEQVMRLRKKQQPQYTYLWRPHKEVTPAQVLSLRATEGFLAAEDPKFGNRMLIQALIRIDMEQSLEVYDRQGNPVHSKPTSDVIDANVGKHPAERRRVTEYLVFEKRMWYDGPWVIREQLWEYTKRE